MYELKISADSTQALKDQVASLLVLLNQDVKEEEKQLDLPLVEKASLHVDDVPKVAESPVSEAVPEMRKVPKKTELSLEDSKAAMQSLMKATNPRKALEVMRSFGVHEIRNLPSDKIADFVEACRKAERGED